MRRPFIQKIVVHEKSTKVVQKALQKIMVNYTDVGCVSGNALQDKEYPPAGNLSIIPAGHISQIVDTPIRGHPRMRCFYFHTS